jgi:hypothetical protein
MAMNNVVRDAYAMGAPDGRHDRLRRFEVKFEDGHAHITSVKNLEQQLGHLADDVGYAAEPVGVALAVGLMLHNSRH